MIFTLLIVACFLIGVILVKQTEFDVTGRSLIMAGFVGSAIAVIIVLWSFDNTAHLVARYDSMIGIHADAIEKYNADVKEYSVQDSGKGILTDFSEQGYQTALGQMTMDYRDLLIEFNKYLIKKQAYKVNPLWSWLISMPPERVVPLLVK